MEIFVVSEKNVKYAQHLTVPSGLFPTGIKAFLSHSLLNETQKRCDKGRLLFRGSWQLCISPSFPSSKGHLHLGTIRLVNLVRTERSSSVLQ